MNEVNMDKQDLREQSDNELSLIVFNDENLYKNIHHSWFLGHIRDEFKFTQKQLEVLLEDISDDYQENYAV